MDETSETTSTPPAESERGAVERWIRHRGSSSTEVDLSVVVPAFNEQYRLPPTLIDLIDYFDTKALRYEVIVVDDGSRDGTSSMVKKFERIRPQLKLIRLPRNYGKGHAVRTGVLSASGARILFADADGATPIGEYARLAAALDQGADIAIGSRALPSPETNVTTSPHRKYLGRLFNWAVNTLTLPGIADTQCGFKLFTASAAHFLFERQTANRFSFDVEILLLARRAGMTIAEVPINWTNIAGSKVSVLRDGMAMLCDVVLFHWRHRDVSPHTLERWLQGRSPQA